MNRTPQPNPRQIALNRTPLSRPQQAGLTQPSPAFSTRSGVGDSTDIPPAVHKLEIISEEEEGGAATDIARARTNFPQMYRVKKKSKKSGKEKSKKSADAAPQLESSRHPASGCSRPLRNNVVILVVLAVIIAIIVGCVVGLSSDSDESAPAPTPTPWQPVLIEMLPAIPGLLSLSYDATTYNFAGQVPALAVDLVLSSLPPPPADSGYVVQIMPVQRRLVVVEYPFSEVCADPITAHAVTQGFSDAVGGLYVEAIPCSETETFLANGTRRLRSPSRKLETVGQMVITIDVPGSVADNALMAGVLAASVRDQAGNGVLSTAVKNAAAQYGVLTQEIDSMAAVTVSTSTRITTVQRQVYVLNRRTAVTDPPTAAPTVELAAATDPPTAAPTVEPAAATDPPTAAPTVEPAAATDPPTAAPTVEPAAVTDPPTAAPTVEPAAATDPPTAAPTVEPAAVTDPPTAAPTVEPAAATDPPTAAPTVEPAAATDPPTAAPTVEPAAATDPPTAAPTVEPAAATDPPTAAPTVEPAAATDPPTASPTFDVTESPTQTPTQTPTQSPTNEPTRRPTESPSAESTPAPTSGSTVCQTC